MVATWVARTLRASAQGRALATLLTQGLREEWMAAPMVLRSPFRSTQRVYFDDLDALNILHNVRYLLFIERARGELFNALGFHWSDDLATNPDKWHVVAEHSIRYLLPFRGEGELSVELTPTKLGTSSLVISASVRSVHGDEIFADGSTRLVRLDPDSNRPTAWSEHFRAALGPLLPSPARADGAS